MELSQTTIYYSDRFTKLLQRGDDSLLIGELDMFLGQSHGKDLHIELLKRLFELKIPKTILTFKSIFVPRESFKKFATYFRPYLKDGEKFKEKNGVIDESEVIDESIFNEQEIQKLLDSLEFDALEQYSDTLFTRLMNDVKEKNMSVDKAMQIYKVAATMSAVTEYWDIDKTLNRSTRYADLYQGYFQKVLK